MGINVRSETERGVQISEVLDRQNHSKNLLPHHSDSSWSCLRFVDRCGDAVFNQLQIPVLLGELRRVHSKLTAPATQNHALAILQLVESVEGQVHTYVRFVGD